MNIIIIGALMDLDQPSWYLYFTVQPSKRQTKRGNSNRAVETARLFWALLSLEEFEENPCYHIY